MAWKLFITYENLIPQFIDLTILIIGILITKQTSKKRSKIKIKKGLTVGVSDSGICTKFFSGERPHGGRAEL